MYSTLLSVALFSSLAIQGALADFTVNTPEITQVRPSSPVTEGHPPHAPISHIQCQPVQLTWASTGAKTYNVALVSSANPCDDVM